jgi:hypothetical protein
LILEHLGLVDLHDLWLWRTGGMMGQPRGDDDVVGDLGAGLPDLGDRGFVFGGVLGGALLEVAG